MRQAEKRTSWNCSCLGGASSIGTRRGVYGKFDPLAGLTANAKLSLDSSGTGRVSIYAGSLDSPSRDTGWGMADSRPASVTTFARDQVSKGS